MVKQRAMRVLKNKKQAEKQLDAIYQQISTMDQTLFMTQSLQDTALQIQSITAANATIKNQMSTMNLDDIDDLYDELEDMFDYQNDMNDLLTRNYDMGLDIDDADLENELMSLEMMDDTSFGYGTQEEEIPSYLTDMVAPEPALNLNDLPSVPSYPVGQLAQQ
eukprot:TRINITY_DN3327_c0_g1_i1.p1 TRINITY_DN3327_c0_g1~~TRINITY_DN3327_c0_g1_i1.p1  ORF type:complete len:163 (+),score=45.22 TRINITY_DN3327_c0_g1_i1:629-1117(+)